MFSLVGDDLVIDVKDLANELGLKPSVIVNQVEQWIPVPDCLDGGYCLGLVDCLRLIREVFVCKVTVSKLVDKINRLHDKSRQHHNAVTGLVDFIVRCKSVGYKKSSIVAMALAIYPDLTKSQICELI